MNFSESKIIENYELLKTAGIIDYINGLQEENRVLEELLNDALQLFNKHKILDLVVYITTKMLYKFIPSYLAFIIQEDLNSDKNRVIIFQNLKLIENFIEIGSLVPYKKFFTLSPTTITFKAFENMMDDKKYTEVLKPLFPELIVPLMGVEGLYGLIVFGEKVVGTNYSPMEIEYLNRVIKFASICLQNIIHYKESILDNKTGLYSFNYFKRRLDEELTRIKRYKTKLSLMLLDIDYFKKFNDKYGHLAGDKLLIKIAEILNDNVRNEDVAARFGGEEFVILLINTTLEKSINSAERIREIIEKTEIDYFGQKLNATVSVGLSFVSAENYVSAKKLINNADCALYESKNNGRNKVTLYEDEIKEECE